MGLLVPNSPRTRQFKHKDEIDDRTNTNTTANLDTNTNTNVKPVGIVTKKNKSDADDRMLSILDKKDTIEQRRARNRMREQDRRDNMTLEKKAKIRENNRLRERERRDNMSSEQKERVRERNRLRSQQRRRSKRQCTSADRDSNTTADIIIL